VSVDTASILVILILVFPLAGAALNGLLGARLGRSFCNVVGTVSIFASFVVACFVLGGVLGAPAGHSATSIRLFQWLDLGSTNLSVGLDFTLDPLSALMVMVITGVGFLIHVYSVGYMEHGPGVARFFSYMNFFIFSMLTLVLAADLLIGFWYERKSAVDAARKAFITQVIGDVAMVFAAFLIVINTGTLSLPNVFAHASTFAFSGALVTGICVLLAVGAFAKSAQFPLHTWLPDAMEGPTPVSALIHAATMVTAGVYLIARFAPLFSRAPIAEGLVACIGIGTALMAGIIALSQIDIKRVIAYSTMSQIGLMIYAVGIGAYSAGMFHFVTHAVFKALLFMAAGNVIHSLHDEQDIRLMGGLASRMRWTHAAFLSGSLALAGIPIFSGWFSKENLLGFGTVAGPGGVPWLLYIVGVGINVLTGLYAFRLWATVFHGEPQTARVYQVKEPGRSMLWPVAILGVLSLVVAWPLQWPIPNTVRLFSDFLAPNFSTATGGLVAEPNVGLALLALLVGTVASLIGAGAAYRIWYQRQPTPAQLVDRLPPSLQPAYRQLALLSYNKFYFDEIYDAAFVRPTRSLARTLRRVVEPNYMDGWIRWLGGVMRGFSVDVRTYQTGLIRDYASLFAVFAVIFVVVTVVLVAR